MTGIGTQSRAAAQILVVDDTPANLMLLKEMLTNHGYRVRPASSGRLALRSVAMETPDLILLDVRMPDMDGYEVCHRLKADADSRAIPVIFISALDSVGDKVRGFAAGGIDYITKPFQEAEVLARVETHLSLRLLQQKLEQQNVQLHQEISVRKHFENELKKHQELLEERISERTMELQEALGKYRSIFENSVEGIFRLSLGGSFINCNPALVAILGYDSPEELTESSFEIENRLYVHPHLGKELLAMLLAGQVIKNYEVEFFRKDGSILWALLGARPIIDEKGRVLYFDGILQDVTDRKQAEAKISEKEAQIRLLLNSIAEGLYGCDADDRCTFCNPSGLQLLGYEREDQLLGKNIHALIHHTRPDGGSYPSEDCRALNSARFTTKIHVDDELFWRRDGSSFNVEYWAHPIQEGGKVTGAVVAFTDITARKQAEEALRKSENLLQSIISTQPDCMMLIDAGAHLIMMNNAGLKMIQVDSFEQVKGQCVLSYISPGYRKAFTELTARVFGGNSGILQFELVGIHGKNVWFEMHAVPFRNEKNNITALLAISRDITEQRILEQQLRQSQKMEVVGTLSGGLAHDFNNVLCGIVGTATVLRMQIDKGKQLTREQLCAKLDIVIELSNRAAEIVNQLMLISRKQNATLAPVDLRNVIKEVVAICKNTFDKSIEFNVNASDGPILINADSGQIQQALLNLCVNASHAMTIMRKEGDPRGGKLFIATERLFADRHFLIYHPSAAENTEYWVLSVRDTGIGMDAKMVSRIFDPFFTTKEKGMGTGLGLAMVYNTVQQHQGFIDVYSEPGVGTTFNVYLPPLDVDPTLVAIGADGEIPVGEGLLLVVDDEQFIRQAAKSILEECGYTVLLAENGEAAVSMFREHNAEIQAVVMDMIMPQKSGLEAFLEIRQIKPDVKILFASGFMQDDRIARLAEMGIKDILKKPYSMRTLAVAVAHVMSR
jgi:PAS domain S-box-containing protein